MKLTTELALKQSLLMTTDMRVAIDMLAMTSEEIDQMITEELDKNLFFEENNAYDDAQRSFHSSTDAYDVALNRQTKSDNFRDDLIQQMRLGKFNRVEIEIGEALIHNLDDDGLLSDAEQTIDWIVKEFDVFSEWVESVRVRIMNLFPLGCGAKTKSESLNHQLKHVCRYRHHEFEKLLSTVQLQSDRSILKGALSDLHNDPHLSELRTLRARPAAHGNSDDDNAIFPDIVVTTQENQTFLSLLKRPSERLVLREYALKDKTFVKEYKQAQFILRALRFRESNLLLVAKAIVDVQADFFVKNLPPKPLILQTIAEMCELHESTISRISRGKYLACHRGVYELKYFFSTSLPSNSDDKEASSARAIKERIKSMIDREIKTSPWSDQKITTALNSEGMNISRRTVTKYRENLRIATAQERRRLL